MPDLPQIGPQEPKTEPAQPTPVNDEVPAISKPFAPLIGFLDVENSELTSKMQDKLQEIWDYLGDKTTVDKLSAIRSLETKLSPPRIGQTRFEKLYQYIQAQKEVERAEKARDVMMGGLRG